MATSPIYNWPEPDNTDLVKNGALAMRTLGDAIDTTMATMVPKTIVDAKGDIIAATAADTVSRLAVGTNGQTLVADSSTATGLKWATPAGGGGKVLQVVQTVATNTTSNSTSTYAAATGLSVAITPSSATSKVLIMLRHQTYASAADASNSLNLRLYRDATNIHYYGTELGLVNTAVKKQLMASTVYLDSPATTSSTTYSVQFANYINGAAVAINDPSSQMTITAMEIGA
jgi:hypothetical protein